MIHHDKLHSGLEIITEQLTETGSFALGIYVKAGAVDNNSGQEGIAHALEHIVFRRSAKNQEDSITEKFERIGAYINAFTSNEYTCFYVRALNEHFEKTFELLSDLVLNAHFTDADVEKEKDIILEEINSAIDEPEELIFDTADELIFGGHPYGNSILGTEKTLKNISAKDLHKFHEEYYVPSNILLVTVSNLPKEEIYKIANKNIQLPTKNIAQHQKTEFLNISKHTENHSKIMNQDLSQTHILSGRLFDAKYRDIAVLSSVILGDGMSSRLYRSIREDSGLAYSIFSTVQAYSNAGIFYIYSACNPKKSEKLMKEIKKNIDKLIKTGITKAEFARALAMLKSGFIMEMEDLSARINFYAKNKILYKDDKDINATLEELMQITDKQINDFHKEIFGKDNEFLTLLQADNNKN